MAKATIKKFGLQAGTTNTVFASWEWKESHTKEYNVRWYYATGNGVWFSGNEGTTKETTSTYSAPDNARKVKFKVQPVSEQHKVNKENVDYWTADWSDESTYAFRSNPPATPSAPTLTMRKYKLTVELNTDDAGSDVIEFQIFRNDKKYKSAKAKINAQHASAKITVSGGGKYKARCRGLKSQGTQYLASTDISNTEEALMETEILASVKEYDYGEWSEYSGDVEAVPAEVKEIETIRARSSTAVYLQWSHADYAKSYEVQYTTKKRYFDASPNEVQSVTVSGVLHAEITGLESGREWFFRVRAVNDQGESGWCEPVSITIGKKPEPPTIWSSKSTSNVGDIVYLYWVHNAEDGSSQTYAEIQLDVDGKVTTITYQNTTNEDKKDLTSVYKLDTSSYADGAKIKWRVRTKGALDVFGDWSEKKVIEVYAPTTLSIGIDAKYDKESAVITSYPISIRAEAGPANKKPIGFKMAIIANKSYTTLDETGSTTQIRNGQEVFSRYYDKNLSNEYQFTITAADVILKNNISYTVVVSVVMSTGLSAEDRDTMKIQWAAQTYDPKASIGIDPNSLSAYIAPYVEDAKGNLISGVLLSVYRREYDGTFTEIITDVENNKITVVDPHPALNYARYRIVATDTETGGISYYDPPGYPVRENAVIIQWDETWTEFDPVDGDTLEDQPWSGSLLRLPYNVDLSTNHSPDVSLVEYIGRKHPVSYYGTQIGETATWNMDIVKEDEETLYALRRLAAWMGDAYVREPSGSGYWAQIQVSFNQNHNEVVIPVTLSITRVEGGV